MASRRSLGLLPERIGFIRWKRPPIERPAIGARPIGNRSLVARPIGLPAQLGKLGTTQLGTGPLSGIPIRDRSFVIGDGPIGGWVPLSRLANWGLVSFFTSSAPTMGTCAPRQKAVAILRAKPWCRIENGSVTQPALATALLTPEGPGPSGKEGPPILGADQPHNTGTGSFPATWDILSWWRHRRPQYQAVSPMVNWPPPQTDLCFPGADERSRIHKRHVVFCVRIRNRTDM